MNGFPSSAEAFAENQSAGRTVTLKVCVAARIRRRAVEVYPFRHTPIAYAVPAES
jgi:hypothetical protein